MAYTTVANVSAYLQTTIDGTTTPTATQVTEWIAEGDSEIDWITKTTYEDVTFTDEVLDLNSDTSATSAQSMDSTGAYAQPANWDFVKLPFKNMLTLTKVEFNTASPSETPVWDEVVIGYGGNVILKDDYIQLINFDKSPFKQVGAIRVSGTYGYASVPLFLQKLATRLASLSFITSAQSNEVAAGGGGIRVGDIEIKEPGAFTQAFIRETENYVDKKMNQLGTHNTYLI